MKSNLSGATRLILGILAVYGAADLLTNSDRRGPHEVLFKLRAALGVYDLDVDGEPETELGRLFACPFCLGMYLAAAMAWLTVRPTPTGDTLLTWLALYGGHTRLLQRWQLMAEREGEE